jgi:hypothetical protein
MIRLKTETRDLKMLDNVGILRLRGLYDNIRKCKVIRGTIKTLIEAHITA